MSKFDILCNTPFMGFRVLFKLVEGLLEVLKTEKICWNGPMFVQIKWIRYRPVRVTIRMNWFELESLSTRYRTIIMKLYFQCIVQSSVQGSCRTKFVHNVSVGLVAVCTVPSASKRKRFKGVFANRSQKFIDIR